MRASRRELFPLLRRRIDDRRIIYLDSAATSLKPQPVLDAERAYSTEFSANVHRGKHALSEEASRAYEGARQRVARFVNADPDTVVFTRNATEAINLVARGLPMPSTPRVVVPIHEHHSNLVPWFRAAEVTVLSGDPTLALDLDRLEQTLRATRPAVLALAHASNVTGVIQPVVEICGLARSLGVVTVIDAAQSAPHLALDVEALGCDFLAFSGHKMLGPTGVGVLWGRREQLARLDPLVLGGGTVDRVTREGFTLKAIPYRFEAGTPNIGGVVGLGRAVEFLDELGMPAVQAHDTALAAELEAQLREVPGVRVLMARGEPRLAIATLVPTTPRITADHLAYYLSETHKIMVRSGHHCAHPLFDSIGAEAGGMRASAYLYNEAEEIRALAAALRELLGRVVGARGG